MQASRIATKAPCHYSREYQIPEAPKSFQINTITDEEIPLQIPISIESLNLPIKVKEPMMANLDDLFEEKRVPETSSIASPLKGILKKSSSNTINHSEFAFDNINELDVLGILIKHSGLKMDSIENYLMKVDIHLGRERRFDIEVVRSNLLAAKNMGEIFHKLKIQLVNGKPKSILPLSNNENSLKISRAPGKNSFANQIHLPTFVTHPSYTQISNLKSNFTQQSFYQRLINDHHRNTIIPRPTQFQPVYNPPAPQIGFGGLRGCVTGYPRSAMLPTLVNCVQDGFQFRQWSQKDLQTISRLITQQNPKNRVTKEEQIEPGLKNQPSANLKTVNCKFFGTKQGCQKGDNCNFIHDAKQQTDKIPKVQKLPSHVNPMPKVKDSNIISHQRLHSILQTSDKTTDLKQLRAIGKQQFELPRKSTNLLERILGTSDRQVNSRSTAKINDWTFEHKIVGPSHLQLPSLEKRFRREMVDFDGDKRIKHN
jgi:hypothetical protein